MDDVSLSSAGRLFQMNAADIVNALVTTTTMIAVNNNGQRMLLRGDPDFLRAHSAAGLGMSQ